MKRYIYSVELPKEQQEDFIRLIRESFDLAETNADGLSLYQKESKFYIDLPEGLPGLRMRLMSKYSLEFCLKLDIDGFEKIVG